MTKRMQMKLLLLLFVTGVLVTSFISSVLPTANALTARTDFSNRHNTARLGSSNVCGDHTCMPGEKSKMLNTMYALQRQGSGKIGQGETYKDVLKHVQTNNPTSSHEPVKLTEKLGVGGNMTSTGKNMTKGLK